MSICDDIVVLDLTRGMAGNLAAMVLADAGAEVIKIEPPTGDPLRDHPAWIMWNRGKKSVVVDLSTAEGVSQFEDLGRSSDVLLTASATPRRSGRAWDLDRIRTGAPQLITCSISGFGPLDRLSHLRGYEGVVKAKTGRGNDLIGTIQKDRPTFEPLNVASYGAAMYACQGVLAALHVRRRTGLGTHVSTSLVQALCAYDWNWIFQGPGHEERRESAVTLTPTPGYFTARTRDGRWIQMSNPPSKVANWLQALGLGEILEDPRFESLRREGRLSPGPLAEELYARLHARMMERDLHEWMDAFEIDDIASEPFLSTQEGLDHPQVRWKRMVVEVTDEQVGESLQVGPIAEFSETPVGPTRGAPSLGQHTESVLVTMGEPREVGMATGRSTPRYPLDGVTVLEFSTYFAGPFGASVLADLGARVIKVEPIGGEPFRSMGSRVQQGKESMAIDLKSEEGRRIVTALIGQADILTHNFRPGVAERLGIGYEAAHALNDRLIYHYAGSYGSTGPSSHRPAMHPIPGAVCGGAMYQTSPTLLPPAEAEVSMAEVRAISSELFKANEGNPDVSAGLCVATALMLALHARERSGQGQYVETTMLLAALYANSDDALRYRDKPERVAPDADVLGLGPLYRLYRARSGWVFIACPRESEWRSLCLALGRQDLPSDPRYESRSTRSEHADELAAELEAEFVMRDASDWEAHMRGFEVPCVEARERAFSDFARTDAEMRSSRLWVTVEHPDPAWGEYGRYGPGVTVEGCDANIGPPTLLGQHTDGILRSLGYTDEAIADLRRRFVVS
jgi:crotonobetainyl-CoA:carnitine CoA-transferase CaiB-like acyl-CoA transferase